jgi:hypothetical protein
MYYLSWEVISASKHFLIVDENQHTNIQILRFMYYQTNQNSSHICCHLKAPTFSHPKEKKEATGTHKT